MTELTIGQVAKAAGVNVETVRYYQRVGLIDEPARPPQGYRRYPAATVSRIRFIKRAQELGFTLNEIRELLRLDAMACDDARGIAEKKHAEIQQRITDLEAIQGELGCLIRTCHEQGKTAGHCAIIESLAHKQNSSA